MLATLTGNQTAANEAVEAPEPHNDAPHEQEGVIHNTSVVIDMVCALVRESQNHRPDQYARIHTDTWVVAVPQTISRNVTDNPQFATPAHTIKLTIRLQPTNPIENCIIVRRTRKGTFRSNKYPPFDEYITLQPTPYIRRTIYDTIRKTTPPPHPVILPDTLSVEITAMP